MTITPRQLAWSLAAAVAGHQHEPGGVRGRALSREKERELLADSLREIGADAALAGHIVRLVEMGQLSPQEAVDLAAA